MSEGAALLREAVEVLLAESPVELPGPVALERLRTVLACTERLQAVQLTGVRDLDSRELYALDAAGSARGWLRRQPGGTDGQVTLARRLAERPAVTEALAAARIGLRGATQLCTALEHVPADLDDALVTAVVQDGIGRLLLEQTGGTPEDETAAAAVLVQRRADAAVLAACVADTTAAPAARVEPAFVLLAQRLAAGQLGSALRLLLDPLQPDGSDQPATDPYYLDLRILADGDVDIRGLLDPETGQNLAAEIERRLQAARAQRAADSSGAEVVVERRDGEVGVDVDVDVDVMPRADAGHDEPLALWDTAENDPADLTDAAEPAQLHTPARPAALNDPAKLNGPAELNDPTGPADPCDPTDADDHASATDAADDDPLLWWDQANAARRAVRPDGEPGHADRSPHNPHRLISIGRQRHDALRDLLTDAAGSVGPGEPAPVHLTITATLDAVHDRLGALPAQLTLSNGRTAPLRPETLQRLGCHSQLDAVLLDALGTPIGASSTRRMPNRAERRALRSRWGPTCAVAGCHRSRTVPHHTVPWWLSHRTRLRDLVPLCSSCHHDLHEGHRTLRLRDGRLIDDHGWVTRAAAAA